MASETPSFLDPQCIRYNRMYFRFVQPVPNWQGIVHVLQKDCEYQGQSTIPFLPIDDMYPGEKTCILSTLQYICNTCIASKHNAPPVVTFGQMLFWKASQIKDEVPDTSQVRDVVLFRKCSYLHQSTRSYRDIGEWEWPLTS